MIARVGNVQRPTGVQGKARGGAEGCARATAVCKPSAAIASQSCYSALWRDNANEVAARISEEHCAASTARGSGAWGIEVGRREGCAITHSTVPAIGGHARKVSALTS